jgi:hypothetical protein
VNWRAGKVRRRLGIPADQTLLAWVVADYRGMQVPGPLMTPLRYWPPYLALTERELWLSSAGATRRYPFEEIVLASLAPDPTGALRVDFTSGDPLVVLVADGGEFRGQLDFELRAFDTRLQMQAPVALGLPDLPPELVAAAELAEHRSAQLLIEHGDDPAFRLASERFASDSREMLHHAQVIALRAQRADLLASRGATIGGAGT